MSIPGGGKARLGGPDRSQGWVEIRREERGAFVAEPAVRPPVVVPAAVVLDDYAGFAERPKLLLVEALVPEPAVEGFDEAVLPGAAGLYIDRLDVIIGQPALEFLGDKLRAVVRADELGRSVELDRLLHQIDDIARLQSPIRAEHMALPRVLVEDRQHPDRSAPDQIGRAHV